MIGISVAPLSPSLMRCFKRGLVADIFRMERAYSCWTKLEATPVESMTKQTEISPELFGAFQSSLITDCVLLTARLFDKTQRAIPTRCIRHVLAFHFRTSIGGARDSATGPTWANAEGR